MHQIQINIIDTKIFQALVEGRLNISWGMLVVPQLAGNEYIFPGYTRLADALANLNLVTIYCGTVKMAIALLQRSLNSVLDFMRRSLPCTETHSRDLRSGVEREGSGKLCSGLRHGCNSSSGGDGGDSLSYWTMNVQ